MAEDRKTMAGPPPEGFRKSLTDPRPVAKEEAARHQEKIEALAKAITVVEDDDFWDEPESDCDKGTCDCPQMDDKALDVEVRTVSSTGGEKGQKLARFDLVPIGPLTELAKHYGRGAQKYADNNWRKGYEWSKNYAAAQRHLTQFWGGEDIDPETGTPHVIAAAWHCFALAEFMQTFPEYDDRHK